MTTTTHPDPNVSPTDPTSNPDNPGDMLPASVDHPIYPGVKVETGHNGDDNDGGNDDPDCAEIVEELLRRVGHIDALSEAAQHLVDAVPRIGNPEGERAFSRLSRVIEQLSGYAEEALQFAEYALALVRKRNGNGGGQS